METVHETIELDGHGHDHTGSEEEMEVVENKRFLLSNVSMSTVPVEVVFDQVEYFIGRAKKKKRILKGISGAFCPGELVVIIGASVCISLPFHLLVCFILFFFTPSQSILTN
jgi:hypothetical protein